AHAASELQAHGQRRLLRRRTAGLADVLVHQVLEHGAAPLVAVGADVGEVVRDGIQLGLLGLEAGLGDGQGTHHGGIPSFQRAGASSCAARWSFCAAFCRSFIWVSNWREAAIIPTIASTTFTLLPSSAPEATRTCASGGTSSPVM